MGRSNSENNFHPKTDTKQRKKVRNAECVKKVDNRTSQVTHTPTLSELSGCFENSITKKHHLFDKIISFLVRQSVMSTQRRNTGKKSINFKLAFLSSDKQEKTVSRKSWLIQRENRWIMYVCVWGRGVCSYIRATVFYDQARKVLLERINSYFVSKHDEEDIPRI